MAKRYDSRTTTFSPEGRLFQVEYAMEAISQAGAAVGIITRSGVTIAAERRILSKLLESSEKEKIYYINEHIAVAVAGISSDANILLNYARVVAQRQLFTYGELIPVEQLVQALCDQKQGYTQFGGLRPYGVSFLIGGWDKEFGFQLYQSDPAGNYTAWKATAIGSNAQSAHALLKSEFVETLSCEEGRELILKILRKSMDKTQLTPENIEMLEVSNDSYSQKVVIRTLTRDEIHAACARIDS
jgi:20S proteasome subunit alpha 3